jgi:hypothetical protein
MRAGRLQSELQRDRGTEQNRRGGDAPGVPAADDHDGERHEAAPAGDALDESVGVGERQVRAAESAHRAGHNEGEPADAVHAQPERIGSRGMLTGGA